MAIEIKEEKLLYFLEELVPMVHRHYDEVDDYFQSTNNPLNPDYNQYLDMDEAGILRCVVARDTDTGRIAGYILYLVQLHPHYKGKIFAMCDMIYVSPLHRKTGVALDMMSYGEEFLGADFISLSEKTAHPLDRLAKAGGYEVLEKVYIKRVAGAT